MRRWGNAASPAYGTLSDYQFMRRHSTNAKRQERARAQWGESLASVEDIAAVFVKYTSGSYAAPSRLMGLEAYTDEACPAWNCCASKSISFHVLARLVWASERAAEKPHSSRQVCLLSGRSSRG